MTTFIIIFILALILVIIAFAVACKYRRSKKDSTPKPKEPTINNKIDGISSLFIEDYTLLDFARMFGPKMQIGEHTSNGKIFHTCKFIKPNGESTDVRFFSQLGELSKEQIKNRKTELFVGKMKSGKYYLHDKNVNEWQEVDLKQVISMRKILLFLFCLSFTMFSYAQRYTGYGRGYDWEGSPSGGGTDSGITLIIMFVLLIIGGIGVLFSKIKEEMGLRTGKYIKGIKNGYMIAMPLSTTTTKQSEVIQTWKFADFVKQFDGIEYGKKKINMFHEHIIYIYCIKGSEKTTINVDFELDTENKYEINEYNVAEIRGGVYFLYKK